MTFALQRIGIVRSTFTERRHTPHQPGIPSTAAGTPDPTATRGRVVLDPIEGIEQALADIEGFERIWLIVLFDRVEGWSPKVLPPRGGRTRRGVFATRSPHRPNPIGLSLVQLLGVRHRTLDVEGLDLLDRTPVLDIKPYHPTAEAHPKARAGWLDEIVENAYTVVWSPESTDRLALLGERGREIESVAAGVLANDPRPHPYRRVRRGEDGRFELALQSWRVVFTVQGTLVSVLAVESGYTPEAVATAPPGTLHDDALHRLVGGRARRQLDG